MGTVLTNRPILFCVEIELFFQIFKDLPEIHGKFSVIDIERNHIIEAVAHEF